MNRKVKYQLLKLILSNGNILEFVNQGYEFGQITKFLDILSEEGSTSFNSENKLVVTEYGREFMKEFAEENNLKNASKWILPQESKWTTPMRQLDIYLPKK